MMSERTTACGSSNATPFLPHIPPAHLSRAKAHLREERLHDEELRNAPQALADAQRADQLAPGEPTYIEVLACAYAANGDFDNALAEQQRAIDLLPASEQSMIDTYSQQITLYQQGTPCQLAPPPEA